MVKQAFASHCRARSVCLS